jgi:hypothetical protein
MRAFAVWSFGAAPALHDLPVPAAGGAFLLRVAYAGVNPLDNNNLARLTADRPCRLAAGGTMRT